MSKDWQVLYLCHLSFNLQVMIEIVNTLCFFGEKKSAPDDLKKELPTVNYQGPISLSDKTTYCKIL